MRGVSETEFDAEVHAPVPPVNRGLDRGREIDFEPQPAGSGAEFPVNVRCPCRGLKSSGVVVARRAS